MQSAFLIVSKQYTEKQAGILFFVFGMSQFLFQTPAGYLYDHTDQKILWLSTASVATTFLTISTAIFAKPEGGNLTLMIILKFIQGAVTSFIPPGLNSISQGIVGANGMTHQVAINEMMNHLGTAIIVLTGSLIGVWLYPDLFWLFVVSPIACAGVLYFLTAINPSDIDHEAARGLVKKDENTSNEAKYDPPKAPDTQVAQNSSTGADADNSQPNFTFGLFSSSGSAASNSSTPHPDTPLHVLRDPALLTFVFIVFLFHTSNGTVLPLVMQTLAIGSGRTGILMSGLCIIVAQVFMVVSARVCGEYSGLYGRKALFLVGLFTVPVRCAILTILVHLRDGSDDMIDDAFAEEQQSSPFLNFLILSTQVLDGVGAGVFGTMYVLVSSDLSAGTGRFSLTLGLTTAAASIGGTVSGYLGEALAEDFGYKEAFFILMFMALLPALLYLFCMPETLATLNEKKELSGLAKVDEAPSSAAPEKTAEPKATKFIELV